MAVGRGRRVCRAHLGATAVLALLVTLPTTAARADPVDDLLTPVTSALDTTLGLGHGAVWGYAPAQTSLAEVATAIGADRVQHRGYTGRGVGVALVDTGLVPVPGLTSGNVVSGPDLSLDSPHVPARHLDAFGHGTHLAGIIAGRDSVDGTGFRGIAPDATLLDVRVGASDGAVDVSQVVAAVDWVVEHRDDPGLDVKVLALAFGTDSTQDYRSDPLTHAVENAWRAGITVVVSGGNKGTLQASLDSPAVDPYVLAVGAVDTHGSATTLDDSVPRFSSRGSASRRVDLVAPGQSVVSLRDPGSYVDTAYPGARVDGRFFKGSGTSQAAAVVAGAAALLLQARPDLTPDQVKGLLTSSARPLLLADPAGRGAGLLDVAAASAAPALPLRQGWPPSTGLGSLELSRGSDHVSDGRVPLVGERDIFGVPWEARTWAAASAAGTAWSGGTWSTRGWAGSCWCATSWAGRSWAPAAWPDTWAGTPFAGHDWSRQSWSRQSWGGAGWRSQSWSSQSWSSQSWSGAGWSGAGWSGAGWSGAGWSGAGWSPAGWPDE